jgi:hypothetical protein
MLDGNRYYEAFPDERPALASLRALLDALARLEAEFRKYLEQAGEDDQAEIGPARPTQDSARS